MTMNNISTNSGLTLSEETYGGYGTKDIYCLEDRELDFSIWKLDFYLG